MKKLILVTLVILTTSLYSADSFNYDILSDTEIRANDNRKFRGAESSFWGLIGISSLSIDYDDWLGTGFDIEEESDSIGFQFGYNASFEEGISFGISLYGSSTDSELSDDVDKLDIEIGTIGMSAFIEAEKSGLMHRGYMRVSGSNSEYDDVIELDQSMFVFGYHVRKMIINGPFILTPQAGIEFRAIAVEDEYGNDAGDEDGANIHIGVAGSYTVHEKVLLGAGIKYYHEFSDWSSAPTISLEGEDTVEVDLGVLFLITDKVQFELKYTMQEAGDATGDGIFAIFSMSF